MQSMHTQHGGSPATLGDVCSASPSRGLRALPGSSTGSAAPATALSVCNVLHCRAKKTLRHLQLWPSNAKWDSQCLPNRATLTCKHMHVQGLSVEIFCKLSHFQPLLANCVFEIDPNQATVSLPGASSFACCYWLAIFFWLKAEGDWDPTPHTQ